MNCKIDANIYSNHNKVKDVTVATNKLKTHKSTRARVIIFIN